MVRGGLRQWPSGHRSDGSGHPTEDANNARTAVLVEKVIASRARRVSFLPAELFGEPAWDLMLQLYVAHLSDQLMSAGRLYRCSAVPASTAVRWLKMLLELGLAEKTEDKPDHRWELVKLTPSGLRAMDSYFSEECTCVSTSRHSPDDPKIVRQLNG